MRYYLTISMWLDGYLLINRIPVVSRIRPDKWSPIESAEARRRFGKVWMVLESMTGIEPHIVTHMTLTPKPIVDGAEPDEQVSLLLHQRHLKRMVPYLVRVCEDHNIHAEFTITTQARFNPACDTCGKRSRRNLWQRNQTSHGRYICQTCLHAEMALTD